MGYHIDAYCFYGVNVPADQWSGPSVLAESDRLDDVLGRMKDEAPDVSHLTAGSYDDDMLFLCIRQNYISSLVVPLGEFRIVPYDSSREADWCAQLLAVVRAMGYRRTSTPGYIVVPDMS